MPNPRSPSPCIVVGTDGSRSATQAALWAIDEAVDRDLPLRLVSATGSGDDAVDVVAAEDAINATVTAIEATGAPVKTETEVVHCRPGTALRHASRYATLVCVGSTGVNHAVRGRIGATAAALAPEARCPVAVVPMPPDPLPPRPGLIVAIADDSPAGAAVVELAADEAERRGAPLQVSGHASVLNHLEYLTRSNTPVQQVVVSPDRPGPIDVLLSPAGRAAYAAAGCTVLIADRRCRS